MFQLEKMPLLWFLLNILKSNFATYYWFWADESHFILGNQQTSPPEPDQNPWDGGCTHE